MLYSHRGASYTVSTAANRAVVEEDVAVRKPVEQTGESGVAQNLLGESRSKY